MPDAIPPLNPQPGQVKLMFPWLAVEPPYVSDWCRVVQVGAGAEFGNILLPDPGSEVLVAFDHGDIRRPYVIGTMYNGLEEMIPQVDCTLTTEGFANQRVYQSRLGSMLYFNDSPETPSVTLQAGEVPDMLSLKFMIEEGSITLSCLGETGISIMAPSGPVSIECMDLSITAEASISLTAPDITIAGEASVTITGAAIELDGDASVMVSAPAVMLGE